MNQPVLMCRACGFMSSCASVGDCCPSDRTLLLPRATLEASARDPWMGRTLGGRYVVLGGPIGAEAVAVYEGFDLRERGVVSIKLVAASASEGGERVDRLAREARVLRRMAHPTLPRVRETGRAADGLTWMVLEPLAGVSLARLIAERRVSPNRAINITLRILAALDRLHAAGLVHGDLFPWAVLVVPGGLRSNDEIKLLDCGAAATPEEAVTSADRGHGPGYRAPEQFSGGAPGPASDLYATGLLLYEMLSGQPPFESGLSFERMLHHCRLPVPRLTLAAEFEPLAEVVYQALDKSPTRRWREARRMAAALKAAFVGREGERIAQTSMPPVAAPESGELKPPLWVMAPEPRDTKPRSLVPAPAPTDSKPPRRRVGVRSGFSLVAVMLGVWAR